MFKSMSLFQFEPIGVLAVMPVYLVSRWSIFFQASRQLSAVVHRAVYFPRRHSCEKPCCASPAFSFIPLAVWSLWGVEGKDMQRKNAPKGKVVGLQQTFSLWIICSQGRYMLQTDSEAQGVFSFSAMVRIPPGTSCSKQENTHAHTQTLALSHTRVWRVLKSKSFSPGPTSRHEMQ